MKAFLIDPKERTVTEVDHDGDYKTVCALLGCPRIDAAGINDKGDVIYVDDEGLFVEDPAFFMYKGFPTPMAGKGLVVGTDEEGADIAPSVDMDHLMTTVFFGFLFKANDGPRFYGDTAESFKK